MCETGTADVSEVTPREHVVTLRKRTSVKQTLKGIHERSADTLRQTELIRSNSVEHVP